MSSTLYTEVGKEGMGKTETTESFFSDRFLRARIDSGQESNRGYIPEHEGSKSNDRLFEEDVNTYIIHGLSSLFHPVTLKLMRRFVVHHYSYLGEIAAQMDRPQK